MSGSAPLALRYYAGGAVVAVMALNLLVRALFKLGGVSATLLVATLVALGVSLIFARREKRLPTLAERWRLVGLYGLILGLLYLGLFGLMLLKDEPGHMGQLLFVLHALSYPTLLALCFTPKLIRHWLP
ncbi:hypothetical protein HNP49_001623 [Pseudomonas fluvialis]|uniref:Transmembrane protein n=1 Tax=Pseudomonas fluvialis TaxID=1793966 RepID=A0A7X0EUD0_9PSED|nr:ABZJ_00895 family protein [Pseudomonas fluvialis]MBB6341466.1 hypothetical protein [Pseudomonas fluvialis]